MPSTAPAASRIRLVCLDVDGTLVGASDRVHPAVWVMAERAREAGIALAVCSGRPGFGVTRALAERLAPSGMHCFQNGASILDLGSGRALSSALEPPVVTMLVARARERGRALELYGDSEYVALSDDERLRRHASLLGIPFAARAPEALAGPVVRAQWLLPHEDAPAVLAEPHPGLELSPSLAPSMADTTFINLTRSGVNKGLAVREMARALDIPLHEVMYVGDGFNDTPAMAIVGWPVAVAHAEASALALARDVVSEPDKGGVADAIGMALATVRPGS